MENQFAFGDTDSRLQIGMVLYPGMTLMDMVGPETPLGLHGQTHLMWKTMDPIVTDSGISILPTITFEDAPRNLDVLFIPGGFGTNDAMEDDEILDFVADLGKRAKYITSVCSGALVLGAVGLLDGYKAATHWASRGALEALGIEAVVSRVVKDGNRITGSGVTAGIDFGLTLLAELKGEEVAKLTQLIIEYDPQPPYDAGTPEAAGTHLTAKAIEILGDTISRGEDIAHAIHAKRPVSQ